MNSALANKYLIDLACLKLWRSASDQGVADWCCENLVFNEPRNVGPFSLVGREYSREILDAFGEPLTFDMTVVTGSQVGKTGVIMGGTGWGAVNWPMRCMWVMPNDKKALSFSNTRWRTMLKASPSTRALIPVGAERHGFAGGMQILGGSIIGFVGSNSATNISSDPCQWVIQDEVDKFATATDKETDASDLADQRTKAQALPKRVKTSTPTIRQGLIWQSLEASDIRRRWVPCPHCGKFVVFVWSKEFTSFDLTGDEAIMVWDKEAKRETKLAGSGAASLWDLDRVSRSARMQCPHCDGHIRNKHKLQLDRLGEYRPSQKGAPGHKGWHLPSFYANSPETSFGNLAIKFLNANHSLRGLQGFVNSECAEPWENQDTRGERLELVCDSLDDGEEKKENLQSAKMLAIDVQQKSPNFWHVAREFNGGDSIAFSAGPLDTWEEVEALQREHEIPPELVIVDSGYGAKSEAHVYRECAARCSIINGYAMGWMPSKGQPGRKMWRDPKTHLYLPWFRKSIDPYMGTSHGGQVEMELFEFSGDVFKDILETLRSGKAQWKWAVKTEVATDEYWRHLDGEIKGMVRNRKTGKTTYGWEPRSQHWPNHMLDCEVQLIALASYMGLFPIDQLSETQ